MDDPNRAQARANREEDGPGLADGPVSAVEHRAALRGMRGLEQRYRWILNQVSDAVVVVDGSARIGYMNAAAEALTGWRFADVRSQPVDEIIALAEPARDVDVGRLTWSQWSKQAVSRRPMLLRDRKGDAIPVALSVAFSPASDPEPLGETILTLQDRTESARTEAALHASEDRFRILFEDMDEGVVINQAVIDEHGDTIDYVIIAANPAFERHSPYRIKDVLGTRATDVYGLTTDFIRDWWRKHSPLQHAAHTEFQHGPSGRWFHVVASPIGEGGRFATFFTDITQRKTAELGLRQSEQRFRAIFDQTFQFIGLLDTKGVLLQANSSALQLAGVSESDVVGKAFWETPWWAHSKQLQEQLRTAVAAAASGEFVRMEVTHPGPDGSMRAVDFSLKPVRDDAGVVSLLIPEGRDITERKQAEEALLKVEVEHRELEARVAHAQKLEAIGRLAAGVAHDFNNLLTVIASCSDLLLETGNVVPDDREMVEEIRAAGKRASRLTNQLLAFSRKTVLKVHLVDLGRLVLDVKLMLERVLGEDVVFEARLQEALWLTELDAGQFEQVIVNLAVNARDAMPRGGKLTIEVHNAVVEPGDRYAAFGVPEGRYVHMSVADTGIGMAPDVRKHAFDPFFTTKEVGRGTGLGLAMVHAVVQQSGGQICVDSELDRGTTFHIFFPVADRKPGERSQVIHKSLRGETRGSETLLLVEDDDAVRAVAVAALRSRGYRVLEARDGREALELFQQHRDAIALLVTDVVMLGMSGRELVEVVQELKPSVRVLYASGYPDDAMVRHGVLRGEVAFLQKPFTGALLAQHVRSVLDA
ncbi:MAG TPA: PAS domain S-box protein [Polyangiaceae bacterium]|jgi:PAS domain S-box-containing protein|nr:PAS domain S-box protein [Polyangiaceae bacterium]